MYVTFTSGCDERDIPVRLPLARNITAAKIGTFVGHIQANPHFCADLLHNAKMTDGFNRLMMRAGGR